MSHLPLYTTSYLSECENTNREVDRCFQEVLVMPETRKSHLFDGRYENIYIDEKTIPAINPVLQNVLQLASELLEKPLASLKYGFWFNHMCPGDSTGPHCHDDDDELLSAVYFISVPEQSGRLLLHDSDQTVIEPVAGMFVFFSPSLVHEVEENRSKHNRLSIGINIGPT